MAILPSSEEHDRNPLDEFKSYLKHVYIHKRCTTLRQYQPFNLFLYPLLVSSSAEKRYFGDDRRNDREVEESISLRLYNYKPAKKSKLKISDIGKCIKAISSTSNTILVEGVPGVGKTAFAWELCHKWAIGELLQDWSIVIFIDLCNEQVREAKLLSDFLYHPDQAMREKICQDLVTSEGKKVIFIVDGLDHLNEQQMPPDDSVIQQLADKELLPSATLIIFSKARSRQHERTDRHIQLSCFTKESINNYITSACSGNNDELLTAFKSYLSSHPYIHNLMHIPALCVMIANLYRLHWNHGDTEFSPSSLTELYTDWVTTLLLRYLSTHREYSQRKWVLKEFTDLPEKANESFMALAELAAKGIEESKYVFDKPADFDTLGLMQKVEEVYPGRENSESYSFLNLTLQEYLAAYYCSQQDSLKRLKIVLRLESPLKHYLDSYCHEYFYDYYRDCQDCHHKAVFLFMAGLAKLQSWNVEALLENGPTPQSLSAMHLLYEAQSPDLIRLATFSVVNLSTKQSTQGLMDVPKPCIPLDLFVIGYCIPHSNRSWQLDTATFSSDQHFCCQLGKEYMKALPLEERKKALLCVLYFKALSKGLDMSLEPSCNTGHIMKLIVCGNNIQWLHLLHPHTQRVTELFIQSVLQLEEDGQREYTKFPQFYPLLKNLLVNGILTKGFLPLLQVIPSLNTLEKLYLWFEVIACLSKNMDDISAISKQLQTCPVTHEITAYDSSFDFPSYFLTISPNLEVLQLFKLTLTPLLTKCETSSLKILKVKSCKIPEDACTALVHFLQSPQCVLEGFLLYSLEFHYRDSSSIPFELVEAIASNCNLKWCAIKGVDDSFVQHLVAGLKKSKGQSRLEELTVLCEYHEKKNCEHCNELIRVVNEHDSIKVFQLSHQFEYYMRNHTIRESLTIPEYDRSSELLSRWQNM